MDDFNMEDVKELLFNQTIASYQERKGMVKYIKQLEEKIKSLEPEAENLTVVE